MKKPVSATNIESNRCDNQSAGNASNLSGRVLVAEDVFENQQLIKLLLKKLGLEVTIVGDGAQAVEKALEGTFDLILMDVQMPNMNGHEATAKLRAEGLTIPIIAVTAYAMAGDDKKCYEAGCTDYLSKPITIDKLREILCKHLKEASVVN